MQVALLRCRIHANLFLRTGHRHEDIDAMFGHWATILIRQPTLQTPQDFCDCLAKHFTDTEFTILSHTRQWSDCVAECLVSIKGVSGSVGTAHSFVWLKRQDYSIEKYGEIKSDFVEATHPCDVILICRKYVSSSKPCQHSLLALPFARVNFLRETGRRPAVKSRLKYSLEQ